MDFAIHPLSVTPTTQFGGSAPQLTPGQIVEAVVLAILKDNLVRISLADITLDVRSEIPLEPGTTLRLAVKGGPEGLKLVPIPNSVHPPAPGQVPPVESARGLVPAAPPVAPGAQPVIPPTTVTAGASPASHAPSPPQDIVTYDLGGARANPGAAARTDAVNGARTPSPPLVPMSVPEVTEPSAALAVAVRHAAPRQGGLAPLLANLEQALDGDAIPAAVRRAALQVLSSRLPTDTEISADDLKQAFTRSGLFLERQLGAGQSGAGDLKLALTLLRQVLSSWVSDGAPAMVPAKFVAVEALALAPVIVNGASAAPNEVPATLNGVPAVPVMAAPPPPPYRGAPTTAQPAMVPTIPDDATPRDVGERLLNQTDQALARQTMMQAASLPDRLQDAHHNDAQGTRWLFEVPLATPQGTSIAQFEISRDGQGQTRGALSSVWRARFSVDVEPMGPVHAQIALIGNRAAVTLWAEREDTSAQLRESTRQLAEGLKQAELEPGDLQVRTGSPRAPQPSRPPAGRFLDRAS